MTATFKKLWKNEYIQTAAIIGLIILIVLGLWFTVQIVLNTAYPALAVVSGSMCIPQDAQCDGWTHPFDRTLHIGDLIIIQGLDPSELNADYPDSDIIVFHKPTDPEELIVHRIAAKEVSEDGTISFYTKGDGNPAHKWPNHIQPTEYDPWGKVSEDLVVGKVIMRIPWVGHAILFMRNSIGLPLIIALMIILLFIEFVLPLLKRNRALKSDLEQLETDLEKRL
ncbi:MAG: S26 family signal peptidase [Candidatus Bathyarchaeota archaeon]|nr:S26 family signal peptidase [Candidatus Bathyarchaeota archaeon]